ncbi:hypothetical protein D3C73_1390170 [compost metagenome]
MLGIKLNEGYTHSLDTQIMDIPNMDSDFKNNMLDVFHQAGAFAGPQVFDSKQAEAFKQLPAFEDVKNIVFNAFTAGMKDVDWFIAIFLLIGALASAVLVRQKHKRAH